MSAITNSAERPFTAVLGSIFGNLQDIVRSEVKLAKTEVREEIAEFTQGATWLAAGILSALFATSFLLVAVFFALSFIVPHWAAALILAGALVVVSAGALAVRRSIVRTMARRNTDLSQTQPKESAA